MGVWDVIVCARSVSVPRALGVWRSVGRIGPGLYLCFRRRRRVTRRNKAVPQFTLLPHPHCYARVCFDPHHKPILAFFSCQGCNRRKCFLIVSLVISVMLSQLRIPGVNLMLCIFTHPL